MGRDEFLRHCRKELTARRFMKGQPRAAAPYVCREDLLSGINQFHHGAIVI